MSQSPLISTRTSFFDDDDLRIVFEFQKPDKSHQKDLATPAILTNTLLRQVTPNGSFQQGNYALHNKTLAYYKTSNTKQPDIVLNLAHARLVILTPISNPSTYGFSVTKNGVKHEFYSQEEQIINNWVNILKSICVLTNFHEEYKALKMIGKGSFAKVYLVESKTNGKSFAVKAFTKESVIASNKANAKPSMLNEIDIMRILDHDNVIKLYEVYETEKSIYLVLELIQGKSLQEVLKKGGFKDNEARTINVISSIIEALAYLAANGIMHRDLKPDNILLDKGDKVKIADFGLATFIDVPEYIFKKCGTPGYIAPEVFKYDQKIPATNYDDRCDVFSAGCIFHYMVFNTAFFDGHNASEILRANRKFVADYQSINNIKTEIKNSASKYPKEALNLLLQLVDFDHKKRPTASQSLTHPYLASSIQQKPSLYDLYQSGTCSPVVFDKRGSFAQELHLLQLKKEASNTNQPRFAEKDSLYLDLGKPELTGKVDTLTSGSANNSLLLQRADSIGSPKSASPFAKNSAQASSFRAAANGSNQQSFLKAAIFRNMANNQDEEYKEDSPLFKKSPEPKHERRHSDFVTTKHANFAKGSVSDKGQSSESEDTDDVSQENPQLQRNLEKMKTSAKHPSKLTESPVKRFSAHYQGQKVCEKGY